MRGGMGTEPPIIDAEFELVRDDRVLPLEGPDDAPAAKPLSGVTVFIALLVVWRIAAQMHWPN